MDHRHSSKSMRLAWAHYYEQMKRSWLLVSLGFLLPGLGTTLVIYVPTLIVAKILGQFSSAQAVSFGSFVPYIVWFAVTWTLGEVLWRIGLHFLIRADKVGMVNLYNQAIEKLLDKDLAFFNDNFAGSLTKKVVGYAKNYEGFVDTLAFSVFSNLIPIVLIVVVLWAFSPWLVVGLLGLMGLTIACVLPFIKRRQKLVNRREAASNVVSGHIADSITNVAAVRTFAHEPHEMHMHEGNVSDYMKKAMASWDYQNLRVDLVTSPFYVLTNTVGLILALAVSRGGALNLQAVFIAFSFYASFTRIMWDFNRIYRNIENSITEAAQFTELLLEQPTVVDEPNAPELHMDEASVAMQDITFRYLDNKGEHLFKDLSINIKPGEKVGLVGRSGGGKTTITKLLLRLMDIQDGEILVSGQNIAKVKQSSLRKHIAYVPQEPLLFHRSIADNIRYGKLAASQKNIEHVAKLAHAHEFIKDLPNGYETLVGERGVKLSGGQRQRIAIARAMLKDSPILVLDEATSSLDSESEVFIQDALWSLMEDKTAIVIAHRLSTIQKMDRIIVLEDGKIIEEGTHKGLLNKKGKYAELWAHQSGGFLEE